MMELILRACKFCLAAGLVSETYFLCSQVSLKIQHFVFKFIHILAKMFILVTFEKSEQKMVFFQEILINSSFCEFIL